MAPNSLLCAGVVVVAVAVVVVVMALTDGEL